VSSAICSDSTTQARDQEEGLVEADLETAQFHASFSALAVGERRFDEGLEQRMAVTRRRGEFRVELDADEPRCIDAAVPSSPAGPRSACGR
jgi:hypothetical protein